MLFRSSCVATESFFAAWCSACYDAMQANARTCLAFVFTHTLRSAQQMHKPQRLVLFENWVCQQAHPHGSKRPRDSPLKGRAPVAHCSLNPIMRNPKDNKWPLRTGCCWSHGLPGPACLTEDTNKQQRLLSTLTALGRRSFATPLSHGAPP